MRCVKEMLLILIFHIKHSGRQAAGKVQLVGWLAGWLGGCRCVGLYGQRHTQRATAMQCDSRHKYGVVGTNV